MNSSDLRTCHHVRTNFHTPCAYCADEDSKSEKYEKELATLRELVGFVDKTVSELTKCRSCFGLATKTSYELPWFYCDLHCPKDYQTVNHKWIIFLDVAYAKQLRAWKALRFPFSGG